ncbi:hypothetical protein HDK90DRAFT_37293 [Phyllosticta capitalensis]|uniref:RING-CH-type domain-containing protein n=1 Tax=Phyllosticta capitalensis TaxID=121624 RepID=A0ABR1Z503_9PEZI
MASSDFEHVPGWTFAKDSPSVSVAGGEPIPTDPNESSFRRRRWSTSLGSVPGSFGTEEEESAFPASPSEPKEDPAPDAPKQQERERHYKPRTCRICLETVLPTFHPLSEHLPGIFQSAAPKVTYESEEGRLISPCKCKGSSRYVHDGCLQGWRHADPSYGTRNYWQCPTCGFKYRLERMTWGAYLSSSAAQVILTLAIFLVAIFLLGFIADPIINLYENPYATIFFGTDYDSYSTASEDFPVEDFIEGWPLHFIKGFMSLGLLSFLKFLLTNPLRLFQPRIVVHSGRNIRTGNTGRDRLANISWLAVAIGIVTFLYGLWKAVRVVARRTLEKASDRVMDIGGDDDDDDEDSASTAADDEGQ